MKALKRIPHKGIVAGVIAGFADYFAVDVTMLRVVFIFFVLVTGFFPGVLGYFLAMLVMPVEAPIIHEHTDQPNPNRS